MAYTKLEIARVLARIDNLPTLPIVASELLKMLGNLNVSMTSISKIMNNDPSITAKVLKIANSAYYSLRKEVDTLRMALVVLGINEITNIIVSLSLMKLFKSEKNDLFDHSSFWKHNIYTAHFSKAISKYFKLPYHGEEFTAGLMHDIGKIVFDQYFHEEFINTLTAHKTSQNSNPLQLEKEIIGATHQELGLWLSEVWKIPQNIRQVVSYHHVPELCILEKELTCVINIANLWTNYIEDNEKYKQQFENLEKSYAWTFLSKGAVYSVKVLSLKIEKEIEIADQFINQMLSN